jgi:hypothetical protein
MHEAGHAVAQLANPPAPWIDSIAITGLPDGLLGLVETPALWQPYMAKWDGFASGHDAWRSLAWKDVINYLAGPIAELRWRRYSRAALWFSAHHYADMCFSDPEPEAHSDLGRVRARLLWGYPEAEREAFIKAWLEAEAAISRHWRAVKAIGRLVHERGRLTDVELLDAWEAHRTSPSVKLQQ